MMDFIRHSGLIREERKFTGIDLSLPAIRLTLCLRLELLILIVVSAICTCWVALAQQQKPRINPLSDYSSILPGQSLKHVIAQGFHCSSNDLAPEWNYCISSPADGPFWYIHLVTTKGVVTSVSFCVREGAIMVGDLTLLW